ncbi:MAG TPA: copper-translocating P-type ATPase, partial [Rhizobiaceae bacterium]|nr:copper-translocating P-type ATPase [Rhizobiaceae bacterium]
ALPAVAYSGRPFYRSAWRALKARKVNMDVPITLGVLLATGMSLFETFMGEHHAWFDASLTLLFFLLIGRYLDHLMREKAGAAVSRLSRLAARGAAVVGADGRIAYTPIDEIEPGMRVSVALGERVPVDGVIADGASDFDRSVVTGESAPEALRQGSRVLAGDLNLTAPVVVEARVRGRETFLAEMVRMMEQAEESRARYRRIADRFAEAYAPAVHILAALTFLGWMAWTRGDWHLSVMTAVAVLIITCPCALGLAVPVVQVVGSGVLLEKGILVRSGSAFERMAEANCAVFDKTGTLTDGQPVLIDTNRIDLRTLSAAASLAAASRHPYSAAIMRAAESRGIDVTLAGGAREHPGHGVEAVVDGRRVRLGRPDWVAEIAATDGGSAGHGSVAFAIEGAPAASLAFRDRLRAGAVTTVGAMTASGFPVEILSGDRADVVHAVGDALGLADSAVHGRLLPEDKIAHVEALKATGRRPLMVGDGINDAPALAAAHVSMAPGSASDVGRTASDFVFLRPDLGAVAEARRVSQRVLSLVRQNFGLALAYNALAVPIAVFGYATPLIAAIAMSTSSMIVVLNALRLRLGERSRRNVVPAFEQQAPEPAE